MVTTYDTLMTVLFRWIFLSTLSRVAAITFAVILIFTTVESVDKAKLLGNGLDLQMLLEYLLLKIPFMISEFMPVIILIGVAIYILEISHHHELAALRAAGVTFVTLLKPLLAAGAVVGLLMFVIGEWVEPLVNKRLGYIERVHIKKEKPLEHGVQWLKEGNTFLRLTPLTQPFFSVLMITKGDDGLWQEYLDAGRGRFEQGQWHLENVYVSKPNQNKGFATHFVENTSVPLNLSPKTAASPDPRDMTWAELRQFEKDLAEAGLESHTYMFQLQRKLAVPLSCLIMVMLAYSLCSSMGERVNANSKGLVISITVGLAFYVLGSAMNVYITGQELPVIYGVWFPNILFLGLAVYLLLKKEGY